MTFYGGLVQIRQCPSFDAYEMLDQLQIKAKIRWENENLQRAQILRLENGYSISITTMSRVFKALGVATATLDLGSVGMIALW